MGKADIARQYRDKYGMEMPTLKLARIMYNENKLTFKDVEDARSALREIEGKHGKSKRYVVSHSYVERSKNPYNLPKSEETDATPYFITGVKRLGILTDIHIPYHNIEALSLAIKYLKDQKVDCLLLNGDAIDCHKLSRYIKDPKKRDFAYELDTFKTVFDVLKKELDCRIIFKIGNHEARYENFLIEKAHELKGISEFEFENILKARAEGITVVKSKQLIIANNLAILHGHELTGGSFSPVNIARGLYNKVKVDALQGHNHQTSTNIEPNLHGEVVRTHSIGCLCELHPEYMPINRWRSEEHTSELQSH